MLKVGSKFYTFDELSRRLEEFQQFEQVQLWVRDSRTVVAAAKRARRKSLNPALKYAELTYSCVFGGRRPSDQTKTHNQTSAGGCPFKVRLSTSNDGQALVVKEICHDHNHEPGKKLHEEPRRLYRNKTNNKTTVRKQVRCVVNKQKLDSGSVTPTCLPPKSQNIQQDTGVVIRLAQSPFHNLQLHNQQQQLQIKIQLENHLQQQRIKQKQLEEVIHFDSPDHIDTPDHLRSPDLTSNFESLGNIFSPAEQYSYLPPSPISPSSVSSTSQAGYTSEEEGVIEPIVDLDVALEEALGDLDSVSSMDLEDKFSFVPIGSRKYVQSADVEPSLTALPISSSPSTSGALASHHDDDPCAPPPTKRFKGRPRKQSFTGKDSEEETDFIGFSPVNSQDESAAATNTTVDQISEQDITHANNMAKQLHVYKPGIDFVSGAKLECLDARDNKWYHCKIVEVDWGELDILVHYERWSVRFDEWLKMDSTRIRPLSLSKKDKNKQFKVGEKVLGFWAPDSCYYLGEIIRIPSEDHFEVLFYDGYTKMLRSSQLKKASEQVDIGAYMTKEGTVMGMPSTKTPVLAPATPEVIRKSIGSNISVLESPPTTPGLSAVTPKGWAYEPEVTTSKVNIFSVEILEAKRKTKRKPDVEELFNSLKKKRKLEEMQEDDFKTFSSMGDVTPSSTPEAKHRKIEYLEKPSNEPDLQVEGQTQKEKEETSDHINLGEYKVPQTVSTPRVTTPKRSDTYFEINIGEDWKKFARKRQNSSHWDVFYVNPIGTKINNRLQFAKNAEKYPCPISVECVDFSYRTAKLEFEAKYGGVLIKHDKVAPPTEASFSEIYEAPAEPFGGKKINITSNEPPKSATRDVEDIDAESSASSASYSSADDDNDDSSGSEDAEEKSPAGDNATQEAVERNSSSGTDEYSDSEMGSRNDNVPSVRLSEFLPESDMKEDQIVNATLQDSNTLSRGSALCLSPKNKTPQSGVTTPVVKREPRKDTAGTLGSQSCKEKNQTPPLSKGAHLYIPRRQSIGSPAMDVQPKPENNFQCPQKSCEKSFRKENLLQMHMKHYHPELIKKDCVTAPNVADLATARMTGDQLDSVLPSSFSYIATPPISLVSSNKLKSKMHTRKATRHDLTNVNKPTLESSVKNVDKEEFNEDAKGSIKSKEEEAALMQKAALEANEIKTKGKITGMKPAPIYSEIYSLRTRKADSVSESVENEDEATDGAGDLQSYEEAIINCICKSTEEDGLMLQCDICLCWQHAGCYNIESEDQVPESYTCSLCDNPKAERSSKRFRHNQDWLKEGKLPRFPFCTGKPSTKLQSFIKRGHELSANVYQLTQLIHSLRLKLNISKAADHPKFVMWHKKWETIKPEELGLEGGTDAQSALISNLSSTASICSQIKQGDKEIQSTIGESETALLATSSSQKVFLQNLPVVSEICLSTLPLDGNAISGIQGAQSALNTEVASSNLPEKIMDIDTLKENIGATDHKENLSVPLPSIGTDQFYSSHIVCSDTKDNLQCISGTLSFSQSKFGTGEQSSSLMIEENLDTYRDCPAILDSTPTSYPQTVLTPDPEVNKYASSSEENMLQDSVCMSINSSEDKNIDQVMDPDDKKTSLTMGLKSTKDIEKSMDVVLFGGESNDDLKNMPIIMSEAGETSNIAESKLDILTKELQNSNSLVELPQATLPVLRDNLSFSVSKPTGLPIEDNNVKEVDNNSLFDPTEGASATVKTILEIKPAVNIPSLNFAEAKSDDLEAVNSAKDSMIEAPEIKPTQSINSYVVDCQNNLVADIESRPIVCKVDESSTAIVCSPLDTMENIATDGNKEKITVPNLEEAYSLDGPIDTMPFKLTNDQVITALKPVEKEMEVESASENVAENINQRPLVAAPVSNRPSCSVVESTSPEEIRNSRESDNDVAKMEVDHKFAADDPETDPAVSLDDEGCDFKFELGASGMNDVPDVSELLGNSSLEPFDEQPTKEIPSHHHAPIIPQAERIEPTNCKLNLLQHVEAVQSHVFQRFDYIEKELNALEAEMGLTSAISKEEEALLNNTDTEDRDAATLQSRALVQLILKDLDTLKKIADFSDRKDIQ